MNKLKTMKFIIIFIIIFSTFFSCKTIDENKIYSTITPELIEIISDYKPEKSKSPNFVIKPFDVNKSTFLLIEFDYKNPPDIQKVIKLNFSDIVLCLPFEKKENTIIDAFLNNNNIMAIEKNEFHLWIKQAKAYSKELRKNNINVHLSLNLDIYKFNFRNNIPYFYSNQYNSLTEKGRNYFHEYIIEFSKYLIEKMELCGLILQNSNFLDQDFIREYVSEIRDFGGKNFFIALFVKGDNLALESLYKTKINAIIDYSFSKAIADCFSLNGSFSKLTQFLSIESLYKYPERKIIFASISEKSIKTNSIKDLLAIFTASMPKIGLLHIESSFFESDKSILSQFNNFRKKYFNSLNIIEIFKSDDIYAYILACDNIELLIVLNKSDKKISNTFFMRVEKNKISNYTLRDLSGGPPVSVINGNISIIVSPFSYKVFYIKTNKKLRNIDKRYSEVISYSLKDKDIKIITFVYISRTKLKSVHLVGDFNNWDMNSLPMIDKYNNGVYQIDVPIPPGKYTYKILLNGKTLIADPNGKEFIDDGNGGKKSVITVW